MTAHVVRSPKRSPCRMLLAVSRSAADCIRAVLSNACMLPALPYRCAPIPATRGRRLLAKATRLRSVKREFDEVGRNRTQRRVFLGPTCVHVVALPLFVTSDEWLCHLRHRDRSIRRTRWKAPREKYDLCESSQRTLPARKSEYVDANPSENEPTDLCPRLADHLRHDIMKRCA